MLLRPLLSGNSVVFIETTEKYETLEALAKVAEERGLAKTGGEFGKALIDRERIMSTGIALGLAVPHAKLKSIPDFFVLAAVCKYPILWDSIDRQPVQLIFTIGAPADRQEDYLKLLSKITLVVKNPGRRDTLLRARTAEQVVAVFDDV